MHADQIEAHEYSNRIDVLRQKQEYTQSYHFDDRMDEVLSIVEELILKRGVFHLVLHFSSSQITCSTFDNPYSFQLYTAEDVFSNVFMRQFVPGSSKIDTRIRHNQVRQILDTLKHLRNRKHGSELRNASLHIVKGCIGLGFACDDTRYIHFEELKIHM